MIREVTFLIKRMGDKSMKKIIALGFIFCLAFLVTTSAFAQQKSVWLKAENENLRLSAGGTIIGNLSKGTELLEMERQGKWVRVVLSGWIWAPSVTENKEEALGPKSRASLIMLEYRQDAVDILAKLKAGESFEELAKLKSIHPTSVKGGDLGFFRRGDFDEKFETAIFALQPNQTSGVVELEVNNKTYFCIFKRVQ